MQISNNILDSYTPKQLKLLIEIEKTIDFSNPVVTIQSRKIKF